MTASSAAAADIGDHTDPAVKGLQLRVRAKGAEFSRTWCFRFKWRGKPVRIVIGHLPTMSLVDARAEALQMRGRLDEGIDPRRARPRRRPAVSPLALSAAPADPAARHSIEHLAAEFLMRHVRPGRKRPEYVERILAADVLPEWKGRDARTIDPGEVIGLLDGIVDRGSRVMANRTAGILGQMFKFGIHRRIVTSSPVQLLYRPGGQEKPRERSLTDAELAALLRDPQSATRYERLAHVIAILLLTGQRRGELALARWPEIDFKAAAWKIPDEHSKTGRGHVVPLSDWALREFHALKQQAGRSSYVLPSPDPARPIDAKQLTRSLARNRARMVKIGIARFTLHDLRRTCRTGLARLGVAPHVAERVLNHAQEKIPGTYDVHDYLDEKRAALAQWADHLHGLMP